MNATRQLGLPGPFDAEPGDDGTWRVRQRGPGAVSVTLRGYAAPPGLDTCTALHLSWPAAGGVLVTAMLPSGPVAGPATAAFVHEPRPGLYRCLPLARYDAGQARFWQRIFRVVRWPGGRLLLGWFAARSRRNAT